MSKARIVMYLHCKKCMSFTNNPDGTHKITSKELLAVGWTKEGLQVFCENCNTNVADLDFLGRRVAYYNPDGKKRRRLSKKADDGEKPSVSGKE